MTKPVWCHRFTCAAPTAHLGKAGTCICHGSDHIAALHKTSNVWFVCLLKSRTNSTEAKQHQGWTVRHKSQKKKKIEAIFSVELTPKCVPSSPPTLSWALSSSRQELKLCKWVTPIKPPTHQVQYENLGHPVMTSGFLFPVKNTAPLSFTYTLSHTQTHSCTHTAHCTLNRAGLGSAIPDTLA